DEPSTEPVFLAPFKCCWAVNFETEDEYLEGEYKADNIVEQSKRRISKVKVTMEVSSDVPPELDAKIASKGYKGGMAYKNSNENSTKRYAVAYEILMSDGNLRRRVIYNVSFTRNAQTNESQDENTGTTYNYDGVGIPLASTGDVEGVMDLKEINKKQTGDKEKALLRFNKFFEQVILPDTEITPKPPTA
ncbi:MAG: hypothetical protein ACRC68_14255, partial [Clostridium sp.]